MKIGFGANRVKVDRLFESKCLVSPSNLRRFVLWPVLVSLLVPGRTARAEKPSPPSPADLASITERGRLLAGYDQAVWHASDALQVANPKTAQGQRCLARLENGKWIVVFGALNADQTRFLISYEAVQLDKPQEFSVTHHDPAAEHAAFFLFAARSLEIALADFGAVSRPYNNAVFPTAEAQFYVYLYPAQSKAGTYPFGGDVRYLISADGATILQKRQLHKTILEPRGAPNHGKTVAGYHTHSLSDVPEDTDVLHVLQQSPPVPERVLTPHFIYEVASDGTIRIRSQKR